MLPDAALRARFAPDPLAYFRVNGVAVDDLSADVRALFDHPMPSPHLTALATATHNLTAADLVEKRPGEPGGFATLCKF